MVVFGFGFGVSSFDSQATIELPGDKDSQGLIEIHGDYSSDEAIFVQDYCSKFTGNKKQLTAAESIKTRPPRFYGLESLQGYLSPIGDVISLCQDKLSTPYVLYQKAKDVAACGSSTKHLSVVIDELTGRLYQWTDLDPTPRPIISTIHGKNCSLVDVKFDKVWSGEAHMLALSDNGTLYSWGTGRHGQLGHGDLESISFPKPVESLQGIRIIGAACGASFSVALSDTGDIYSFGLNDHGQLGIGTNKKDDERRNTLYPQLVDFYDGVQCIDVHINKVTCGRSHTVVLDDNGQAWSCGWNKYGQTCQINLSSSNRGNNEQLSQYYFRKVAGQNSKRWKDVVCGSWSTFLWTE
ncbi:hypothetical protein BGZ76_010224 [Entomortierella beljakovae]|nr:hypothetical protein BGZ76_010224 [Entomortierella beljakovae]